MEEVDSKPLEQVPAKKIRKRSYFAQLVLGSAIGAFGLLALMAKQNPYFGLDLEITLAVQQIENSLFDSYMKLITLIGNFEWVIVTSIMITIFLVLLRKQYQALFFAFSVITIFLVTLILKLMVGRPRPDPELINQLSPFFYPDSFPSGHVTYYIGAFGFLLYLVFTELKRGLLRTVLIAVLSIMILSIGISRIYVGAHWFSDTLGAYLIGAIWLYLTIYFYRKFLNNKNQ